MDSGELEMYRGFEELTARNVKAGIYYGNETRRLVRETQLKITALESQLRQANQAIEELRKLIVNLQIKAYNGGT